MPVGTSFHQFSNKLLLFPSRISHSFTQIPSLLSPQTKLLSLCHSFAWSLCFSSSRFEHFQAALFEQKSFFACFVSLKLFLVGTIANWGHRRRKIRMCGAQNNFLVCPHQHFVRTIEQGRKLHLPCILVKYLEWLLYPSQVFLLLRL